MERIVKTLKDTLNKSFLSDLRGYLELHAGTENFSIYSDYCLDAEGKFNNVLSFTIAPSWTATPELIELIGLKIHKDIKKTKVISDDTIEVLTNNIFFHANFVITNLSGMLYSEIYSERIVAIKGVEMAIDIINMWISNQPEGKDKFTEQIKRFTSVKQILHRKTANLKLFKYVSIVAVIASYLAFLLSTEAKCKRIIWFSDRDKIIDSFENICFDLFEINHFGMCLNTLPDNEIPAVGYGIRDANSDDLWFDNLIRIPDYMAGTISSWDMKNNRVSKDKHAVILQKVFAENPFCSIIDVTLSRDIFSFHRKTVGHDTHS